jgi:DNA-binding Xre family transcriptional regulator
VGAVWVSHTKNFGLSTASMAKLAKGRNINTDVLVRVCNFLRCDISDICEVILADEEPKEAEN